jgi:hypothetical protein
MTGWAPQYNREAMERAALRSSYRGAAQQAGAQALGAARTGYGNPLARARIGANAAASAGARVLGQQANAQTQLALQQQARLAQEAEERRTRTERMIGGALGAAGQLAGMVIPGAGALGGIAGAISPGGFVPGQGIVTGQYGGAPRMALGDRDASFRSFDAFRDVRRADGDMMPTTMRMVDRAIGVPLSEEEMRRQMLGGGY